jgi:hypothetical protein
MTEMAHPGYLGWGESRGNDPPRGVGEWQLSVHGPRTACGEALRPGGCAGQLGLTDPRQG